MPPWANGKNGKEFRATMGRKPIVGIFSVGRRGAVPLEGLGAERRRDPALGGWTASPTGCGRGSPNSPATLHDQRWLQVGRGDLSAGTTANERYLRNEAPLARVAWSTRSRRRWFYGGEQARAKVEDHTLGLYQALIEARIPFEMVHDRLLDAEHVDRVQDADPAEHRRALGRSSASSSARSSSAAAASSRRTRPRSTTSGACGGRTSAWPICSALVRRARSKARCRTRICGSSTIRDRQRHPLLAGLEDAPRIINGV